MLNLSKVYFISLCLCIVISFGTIAHAQTSYFTFQGKLTDTMIDANGPYDFTFKLFDSVANGTQIGADFIIADENVANGIFTVQLDFGSAAFTNGAPRFIEIHVRPGASTGLFTPLAPRQEVNSSPFAIKSLKADTANTATNSAQLGGVAASQYVQTTDPRLTNDRNPTAGSLNYIQNTISYQADTNFFIGGTGRANIFDGAEFYTLGQRVLKNDIGRNLLVGFGAGNAISSGQDNSFFGDGTAFSNSTGSGNSFFGTDSGSVNFTGNNNSLFGAKSFVQFTDLTNASAFGSRATVGANHSLVLGSINGVNNCSPPACDTVKVGIGTTTPTNRLDLNLGNAAPVDSGITIRGASSTLGDIGLRINNTNGGNEWYIDSTGTGSGYGAGNLAITRFGVSPAYFLINPSGVVTINNLGASGPPNSLCRNASNQLSTCSSSLRYKTNVQTYFGGLDIIRRLRPITFDWRDGGMHDIGFAAEDVNAIEPLLTNFNDKGQIEGVKYSQITTALVNAVNEQQSQLEQQTKQIDQLKLQIELLKTALCSDKPSLEICKPNK